MSNQINKMKSFNTFMGESDSVSTEDKYKVADLLTETYKSAANEAKSWAGDVHDEHTEESYMTENAALVAVLAADALKECKEYTTEQFEAAINAMKESYSKKLNEILEMHGSGEEEE